MVGSVAGLPTMACAALGYAAVGSAANTLLAPVLIGMEVFGVKNGLAVKKRKYTVKYRKTTAP